MTFTEYLKENDGGGVAFSTPNSNGMGNVVAPTVGSVPGSVNQNGSGNIGSGDIPAYDRSNNNFKISKKTKKKKRKKTKFFTKK